MITEGFRGRTDLPGRGQLALPHFAADQLGSQQVAILRGDRSCIEILTDVSAAFQPDLGSRSRSRQNLAQCALKGAALLRRRKPASSTDYFRNVTDRRTNGRQTDGHCLKQRPGHAF